MTLDRIAMLGLMVLVGAALVLGWNPHPHVWWEAVPIYGAVFGYAGAWLLIVIAKSVLAPVLRDEGEEHGE